MKNVSKPYDVQGLELDPQTRCRHWNSERDIVAIRLPCCDAYYACYECHVALAGHPAARWPKSAFATEQAVLCGACRTTLTIEAYLRCGDACPHCGAAFNPGCRLHRHLYFEKS